MAIDFGIGSRFATSLGKAQITTLVLTAIANALAFLAVLTPAWQTADDQDARTRVDSGLWLYCPGNQQCWYIFSDNLVNYYEKVDVCRFLLIGDCRKKLLRTPYFFGWHYAVLIMMVIAILFSFGGVVALVVSYLRPHIRKVATVIMDLLLAFSFLIYAIALAVFMINAEMLESRFLIGIRNTFEKSYGYSFYIACIGLTILMFAVFAAMLVTTYVFFFRENPDQFDPFKYPPSVVGGPGQDYTVMHNIGSVTTV
uniref:Clc-like protein 2 n=1 Tax=Panagrellus redivivus TaxID=6233 RepID=A0A7E4W538_PANRE